MASLVYGPGIMDALERRDTSLADLLTLREHAQTILQAQGDLASAIAQLETEITRRQRK